MDNQPTVVENSSNVASAKVNKSKFWIVGIVIGLIAIMIGIGIIAFVLPHETTEGEDTPAVAMVDRNTDLLQLYSELKREIPIDDIYTEVKNINAAANVELDDGFGEITMDGDSGEYISFYFEKEDIVVPEDDTETDDEPIDANVAYGFTYVMPLDEENGISISCTRTCDYFDGEESHSYDNKQDAIKAFLGN